MTNVTNNKQNKNKFNINIGNVNIRSLNSGFDLFKDIISENSLDVIGITETWLQEDFPSKYVSIKDYNLVRSDRPTRGGGVGIYLKQCYKFKVYYKHENFDSGLEQLWIKINMNKYNIGIGIIYRPPNVNVNCLREFFDILENIYLEVNSVIVLGDININLLKNNNDTSFFNLNLANFNLKQVSYKSNGRQ